MFCLNCLPADASIGQRLRAFRVAAKLTQTELALKVGVDTSMISAWERGYKQPLRPNLVKLGHILGAECISNSTLHCPRRKTISCQDCGKLITKFLKSVYGNGRVWCLDCLAKHPEAPFGQRLVSHRLAAGMTQRELAAKAGVFSASVAWYERDKGLPASDSLAKLARVLGPQLLAPA